MLKNITRQVLDKLSRHLPHRLVSRDPLPDGKTLAATPIPDSLSKQCLNVAAMDENEIWRAFIAGAVPDDWPRFSADNQVVLHVAQGAVGVGADMFAARLGLWQRP